MKSQYKIAIAMLASGALGALAVQGLHAQAKPPAYLITETETIDEAAFKEFQSKVIPLVQAAGGKNLVRGGQIIALEGQAPKRVVVTVYDNVEKAQAFRTSAAWKEITPLREKAVKARAYIAEGVAN